MSSILLEPAEVDSLRKQDDVVILDLGQPSQYVSAHIPEAHYLAYGLIVRAARPVAGLLPEPAVFSRILSNLGIGPGTRVIAYDDEGGGCASRLVWTLNVFGHANASIINGGIYSWANEGHEIASLSPVANTPTAYTLEYTGSETADAAYILEHLDDAKLALLDARTKDEYTGKKRMADKAGHIPGAVHYEWTDAMNRNDNMRMLPAEQVQAGLDAAGLGKDKEIVCYCQSHHRSAFSWLMLKSLGYENVKGYPGSWSDWGNRPETPVEA